METERYVLFSPIGMTDPIYGEHDGSMLHIARMYRPERIYLYLSKETGELDAEDDRYAGTLARLGEKLGHKFDVVKIFRPNLTNVHLFDEFYDDFENLLKQVKEENPGAAVLLNVSSGTPAMKSSLNTIAALTKGAVYTPVQVETPRKSHNERKEDVKEYDLELQWAFDKDNDDSPKNRCIYPEYYNLMLKVKKEIIRSHVDAYDYGAARSLADGCGLGVSDTAKAYLRAACARVQLDARSMTEHLAQARADSRVLLLFTPVRDGRLRSVAEYLLWLDMKLKRAEFCDFIRGISPVFLDLLEAAADKACGESIDAFCRRFGEGKRILSIDRMSGNPLGERILGILEEAFKGYGGYHNSDLSPAQLVPVIEAMSNDESLKKRVKDLRNAEQNCRHMAAHEIVSVTEEWIKERCGLTPSDILAELNGIAEYIGVKRSEITGSYEKMNELIKESLG